MFMAKSERFAADTAAATVCEIVGESANVVVRVGKHSNLQNVASVRATTLT